jgi:hypothetical protein
MPYAEFQPSPVDPIGSVERGMNLFDRAQRSQMQREAFAMEKQKFASDVAFESIARDSELKTKDLQLKQLRMQFDALPRELDSHTLALDAQDAESRMKIENAKVVTATIRQLPDAVSQTVAQLSNPSIPERDRIFLGTQFLTNYGHLVDKSPQIGQLLNGVSMQIQNLQHGMQARALNSVPVMSAKIGATKSLDELNRIAADPEFHNVLAVAPEIKEAVKDQRDFLQKQLEATTAEQAKLTEKNRVDQGEKSIPGFKGLVPTVDEAKKLREELPAQTGILDGLKRLNDMFSVPNASTDLKLRAEADTIIGTLVGALRVPITGPGAMTDGERTFIQGLIGSPTKLFSLSSVEKVKLKTITGRLQKALDDRVKLLGLERISGSDTKGGTLSPADIVAAAKRHLSQ